MAAIKFRATSLAHHYLSLNSRKCYMKENVSKNLKEGGGAERRHLLWGSNIVNMG